MPSRQRAARIDSISAAARSQSNVARPSATKALSQFHWCGYCARAGTVHLPVSLARRTRRAAAASGSVTGEADQQAGDVPRRVLQVDQADVLVGAVREVALAEP